MSFNGRVITAPVSISDVQQALGDGRNDLGLLCTSNNIAKWAKFRPIEVKTSGNANIIGQLSEGTLSSDRARANYGIKDIPSWTRYFGKMMNFWTGTDTSSTNYPDNYNSIPKGGWWAMVLPTSVYRLTDFVSTDNPSTMGYFVGAQPPVGGVELVSRSNSQITIQFSMGLDGVSAGLTIKYGDLTVMRNKNFTTTYFGVAIKAGSSIYLATQSFQVGDLDTSGDTLWSHTAVVRFLLGTSAESGDIVTYAQNETPVTVFPVLSSLMKDYSSTAITTMSSDAGSNHFFIPLIDAQSVVLPKIYTVQAIITYMRAYRLRNASNRYIYFDITFMNNDPTTAHYFMLYVDVIDKNDNVIASTQYGELMVSAGSLYTKSDYVDGGQQYTGATQIRFTISRDAINDSESRTPYFISTVDSQPIEILNSAPGPSPYAT